MQIEIARKVFVKRLMLYNVMEVLSAIPNLFSAYGRKDRVNGLIQFLRDVIAPVDHYRSDCLHQHYEVKEPTVRRTPHF
jgi:hypothetical protein